jgi:hypothetical protein
MNIACKLMPFSLGMSFLMTEAALAGGLLSYDLWGKLAEVKRVLAESLAAGGWVCPAWLRVDTCLAV